MRFRSALQPVKKEINFATAFSSAPRPRPPLTPALTLSFLSRQYRHRQTCPPPPPPLVLVLCSLAVVLSLLCVVLVVRCCLHERLSCLGFQITSPSSVLDWSPVCVCVQQRRARTRWRWRCRRRRRRALRAPRAPARTSTRRSRRSPATSRFATPAPTSGISYSYSYYRSLYRRELLLHEYSCSVNAYLWRADRSGRRRRRAARWLPCPLRAPYAIVRYTVHTVRVRAYTHMHAAIRIAFAWGSDLLRGFTGLSSK